VNCSEEVLVAPWPNNSMAIKLAACANAASSNWGVNKSAEVLNELTITNTGF
jgi:hypothetical protein